MDFGEVFGKAWKIIWKYKILWVFGILAGLGSGAGTNSGNSFRYTYQGNEFPQVQRFFENIPIWVWLLVVLFFILLVIIIYILSTIGHIGLIKGTLQADEEAASVSFGKLFSESLNYFWRIFGLTLMVGVVSFVVVLVILVPIIIIGIATIVGIICVIPLICLLFPISWLITLFIEQSIIVIVVEDTGIFDGLSRGWKVVINNIGVMILMALIIFVGGGILNFIITLPLFLIAMPVVINLIASSGQTIGAGLIVTVVLFFIYLPILLFLNGVVKAYTSAAWTLTYRRLTSKHPANPPALPVTPVEPLPTIEPTSPVEPAPPTE